MKQALAGKVFGTFVSTGTPGGGQELTAFQSLSVAIHHGMVFVPIGYQIGEITNLDEVHGGSPWGTTHPPFRPRLCELVLTLVRFRSRYVCWVGWFASTHCVGIRRRQKTGPNLCPIRFQIQLTSYRRRPRSTRPGTGGTKTRAPTTTTTTANNNNNEIFGCGGGRRSGSGGE